MRSSASFAIALGVLVGLFLALTSGLTSRMVDAGYPGPAVWVFGIGVTAVVIVGWVTLKGRR